MFIFRDPSISDEKNCRAGGNNTRPCCDCQERLDGVLSPAAESEPSAQLKRSAFKCTQ